VTFTTAQASSHVYPSSTDFEALTALTDVEKTVDINYAGVYSDTTIQISARFDNDGVDTFFLINTLGFFAQLGTDTPILFAVSTAVTPDQMPMFDADNPSAFIYNMQMTVQNADSINLSVNPAGTVTVDQLNAVVSTINASIGDLSDLTTTDKSSIVDAINEVDANADAAQASADIVQAQVSNSGDAYDPTRPYKVNELCIYNNVLYRCTTACSAGSWATNQSCFTQDTLTSLVNGNAGDIRKIKYPYYGFKNVLEPQLLADDLDIRQMILTFVNQLDTEGLACCISCILASSGYSYASGVIYSDKAYGSLIVTRYDGTCVIWQRYNHVDYLYDISRTIR
jgi:hypothetical protein